MKERCTRILAVLTDLLFPRRCPVCDRPVEPSGAYICGACRKKLIFIKEPRCLKCGKQLREKEKEYCYDCGGKTHIYDRGIALYTYGSIRPALYRLKYGGRREGLVPVPLHPAREKKRGYNQAALLAEEMGKCLNIPVFSGLVERSRNTCPQKELDGAARQINLKKAFKIAQNDVKLNTIVIIDDIYTTGSTIDAVAEVCRNAGIKHVYFVALAIGRGM